ncbi:MAG: LacI family DNA-binding transcriptional regulator [Solirubrobacteraceae bacterium]
MSPSTNGTSNGGRRRATRADVAQLAGTSTAVVSYVINNGPRPVAPETAERVRAAIRDLNYRPNAVARSLRLQRTHALGLVVPDLANPFFAELASAIEMNAAEYGQALLLGNSLDSEEREARNLRTFGDYRVDGLIIVPVASGSGSVALLRDLDMPVVVLDRPVPGAGAPTVMPDNRAGAAAATQHLLEHGYAEVGCIAGPEAIMTAAERLQGWRQAIAAAGLNAHERWVVHSEFDRDAGYRVAIELLSQPARPRALFVSSDEQAFGVLKASARLGLRVPDDLALVGFDGLRHSRSTVPSLATMRQPFERYGELAVSLIHQNRAGMSEITRLPVTLQSGGTCGCSDDPREGV